MADEIKKVKIKDLPQTTSINDDDIFVESDSIETYKVTADDIAKYVSTNENLTGNYIAKTAIGATNGVAPLNSNKKINGTYITYGTTSNTAYEGSSGKILETNLDNHLTDEDAHGYNTKINNEIARAKNAENSLSTNKLDKTTVATSSTLGLVKSGTDITVDAFGNVSVNDNSHKHTVSNISDLTATATELNVLDGITATTQELNYVDGVTSNIQTQLNSKSANGHTHDDRYYTETEIDNKVADINSSITSHTGNTSNPHSVTKAQVGLGNVENKSSATIRGELTKSNITTALGYTPLNQTLKGAASGLAELDSNGKVPSSQLPSFVDDVVEGYLSGGKFYKESAHTTEISGETGKIYIDLSTEKTYRWSGSAFVVISETLALGETSSTAYRGDRGKTAYDHSQSTHARTDATKVEKSSTNGNIKINGTETTVYTHPSGTNPHGTTKSDVGLGNVGNFKAVSTVAKQGLTDTEKSNARANIGAGTSSFSGSYNDLTNKPTIPTNNNQLTNGAGYITSSGTAKTISDTLPISKGGTGQTTAINAANTLINSLEVGDTAPTDDTNIVVQGIGNYSNKFYRKPVSLLWNYIKSKLAIVATSGSYNDLSNKPTIPSVGNGTVTIKQAGTSKGTFTMNQTGDTTIELTDNNTTYSSKSAASGGTNVSLVTTGEKYTWNNKSDLKIGTTSTTAAAGNHTHSAYANQNAFSNVVVGSTTIAADSTTDTLTLVAGTNITLTPDATNDKITISSSGGTSYTLPVATSSALGGVKSGTDITVDSSGNVSVNDDSHNHVISNVDGLQSALDGKASSSHTHSQYLTSHQDISGKLDNSATGADSLLSKITTSWTAIPTDDTYFIRQDTGGGNNFGRVKFSTLWSYIKGKADKVYSASSHTHNYAGSSSAGGSATSAVKLDSSAGSATQPVYFSSGKPVATTYTLGTSVPSGAVFTDTKNTAGSTNTSSKIFLVGATSQATNPQTYSHDTAYVGTDGCLYSNSTRVVSEVISSTEPTNQKNGDYWLQDY